MRSFILVALFIVIKTTRVLSQEPSTCDGCTRFGCESKILERLIKLEIDNEKLKQKVAVLEANRKDKATLVVKMRISADMSVRDGQRIKYNLPVLNNLNAYNVESGEFVAPVTGLYTISVTVSLDNDKWLTHQLFHNGGIVDQFFSGNPFHSSSNKVSVVHLEKDDKIWMEKFKGTATVLSEDYGWNSLEILYLGETSSNTLQLKP